MKLASKCDTHVHAPRRDVTMIFETREPDYPKIKADLDIAAAMIRKADSFTDAKEAFRRYNEAYKELSSRYARIFLKLYHDVSCEETMVQLAANIEHLNELVHYAPFGSAVAESPWRDQLEACYGKPAILLLAFKLINWRIPVCYVGTVAVFGAIIYAVSPSYTPEPLFHILTGGLLLGAIFMATDMVTSPITPLGAIVFGVGCGVITSVIRFWGNYPEGVSFSILFMNALVPLIDRFCGIRPFGYSIKREKLEVAK